LNAVHLRQPSGITGQSGRNPQATTILGNRRWIVADVIA
jgi:hypothetical protein